MSGDGFAAEALRAGEPVGFVSLEMSVPQLAARLYAIATGTDIRTVERGDSFTAEGFKDVRGKLRALHTEAGGADFFVAENVYSVAEVHCRPVGHKLRAWKCIVGT